MMGRREDSRKVKLAILSKIQEKKDILFGSFSSTLTTEAKKEAWKSIAIYAKALGVKGNGLPNYMRDIWWPSVRKSTLEKQEDGKLPGGCERLAKRWNEIDDLVLNIMDKESPQVAVAVENTGNADDEAPKHGELARYEDTINYTKFEFVVDDDDVEDEEITDETIAPTNDNFASRVKVSELETKIQKKLNSKVVKTKIQLEMDLLKIQIYKTTLEARQLEMAMSLPHSSYTAGIGEKAGAKKKKPTPSLDSFDSNW